MSVCFEDEDACWVELEESVSGSVGEPPDRPLMQRFHKPEDEKRMVAILDPADYDRWLDCPTDQMTGMLQRWLAELMLAEAAPPMPRSRV